MEARSLVSHQHSWWFSCFSLREKLAWSHNKKLVFKNKASNLKTGVGYLTLSLVLFFLDTLLISLFNTGFGINLFMAKIFVGLLLFVVSWTVQTRFIFKERTCYPVWNSLRKLIYTPRFLACFWQVPLPIRC